MRALFNVLLITLAMHLAATAMRFTATLDAIASGASAFWVGAMLACISLGPMFFAVSAGRWLDRSGPTSPLLTARIGMILAGLSVIALPAKTYGMTSLFAAALLTGFAFMLTNVVIQRLTGDVSTPKTRRFAFTALSLTTASSNLAAPVVAGYVIEHVSYAAVYSAAVVMPILLSLAMLTPSMKAVLGSAKSRQPKETTKKGKAKDFFLDPPMRAVLIASVMISVAWEVGNLLIPIYADSVGLTPSQIGWVLGSFATATFVVRFLTPFLLKVILEWHMIVMSLLLAAVALSVMPLTTSPYALMAAAFVLGLGLGASLPNMMSLVYLFAPPDRIGEALGLRIMCLNGGKSAFPVLAGLLGTYIGAGATLWVLALFTAGGFGYALASARTVLTRMRTLRADKDKD